MLNITKEYNSRIYYYGYELFDDVRPLSPDFTLFIDQKNLPTIFHFVLSHIQTKSTINQNTQLILNRKQQSYSIDLNMEDNISHDVDDDNNTDFWKTDYETFFRNFAFVYYIRLFIYVVISNRNSMKISDEIIEDVDYFLSGNCNLNEVLLDLYEYCDEDKCSKLDKAECQIGLIILFEYLNEKIFYFINENKQSTKVEQLYLVYKNFYSY
ncbi:unnamed protein product [Adineta steineri]|uniref:Uncharacterized protein n=2 Tax=Adineta steineri TaxID=433720 RepID=A0A815TDI0_9BILA|nr:unnamed protein product [Adineta steineri]CAF1506809.1 unnamed protein product [Adineta steineri]CAF4121311.1 unnamed protein product [Adineta steineri]